MPPSTKHTTAKAVAEALSWAAILSFPLWMEPALRGAGALFLALGWL